MKEQVLEEEGELRHLVVVVAPAAQPLILAEEVEEEAEEGQVPTISLVLPLESTMLTSIWMQHASDKRRSNEILSVFL